MKISFVLLIKIQSHHRHNELDRLKSIQLKSFRKFLDVSILKDFFIVASREDIKTIKDDLLQSYPEFPFVFVAEDELCPSIGAAAGWTKQMILKLAIANRVDTDYYLTLDTDVFLTKKLSGADILQEGKLVYQKENPRTHKKWWRSSAHLLNVAADRVLKEEFAMGVTPEYLVTEVCRGLQTEIESLHGTKDFAFWLMKSRMSKKSLPNKIIRALCQTAPFITGLLPKSRVDLAQTCDWTEYSLYWTYLNKLQLAQKYYAKNGRQVYGNCIWAEGDIKENDLRAPVEKAFRDNAQYHFSIIQSSIKNLDQSRLAELVGSFLD
jgi:hypothetical protein